jgi:hypothetical protein
MKVPARLENALEFVQCGIGWGRQAAPCTYNFGCPVVFVSARLTGPRAILCVPLFCPLGPAVGVGSAGPACGPTRTPEASGGREPSADGPLPDGSLQASKSHRLLGCKGRHAGRKERGTEDVAITRTSTRQQSGAVLSPSRRGMPR